MIGSTRKILKSKWVFLLLLLPLMWAALHLLLRQKPALRPTMIAHRGGGGLAPENTLAAVEAGLAHNADGIEVDVSRSADGILVVMHDTTVDRTTNGSGPVAKLTWAELSQLDAGSHFSADFAGEPIPSLETILERLEATNSTLVIEVKDPELYPGLETDLLALLDPFTAQERVRVISFDVDWLLKFHQIAPEIPTGALSYWVLTPPQIPAMDVAIVFWPSIILDPTLIYRLHQAGFSVATFTVNNPQLMRWLLWLGADVIITDRPDLWPTALNP